MPQKQHVVKVVDCWGVIDVCLSPDGHHRSMHSSIPGTNALPPGHYELVRTSCDHTVCNDGTFKRCPVCKQILSDRRRYNRRQS